jgi:hypothetical protein
MKKTPRLLYRYMDATTAWECLEEGSLAFTPPARFNDPFDTNPALDFDISEEQLEILRQRRPSKRPFDPVRTMAAMRKTRHAFMHNTIGVACFTSVKNGPLMWAHYGDKHKGVMLCFDSKHSALHGLRPVNYSRARPCVDSEGSNAGEALLVKSSVWKREKEWRLTAQLSQCEVKMMSGVPVYIQRPNRECFVSITFGCRADDAFIRAVANGLRQWNMKHCRLRRLHLCEKTYSFKVRESMVEDLFQLKG